VVAHALHAVGKSCDAFGFRQLSRLDVDLVRHPQTLAHVYDQIDGPVPDRVSGDGAGEFNHVLRAVRIDVQIRSIELPAASRCCRRPT
jgi:hypothetical protein